MPQTAQGLFAIGLASRRLRRLSTCFVLISIIVVEDFVHGGNARNWLNRAQPVVPELYQLLHLGLPEAPAQLDVEGRSSEARPPTDRTSR